MNVYIRPNGDDKNDGSEKAPVKSPKRAIAIANRTKDNEINLLTTDWRGSIARSTPRRISFRRAADRITTPQNGGHA